MNRRKYLKTIGATAIITGGAGCSDSESGNPEGTDEPDSGTESKDTETTANSAVDTDTTTRTEGQTESETETQTDTETETETQTEVEAVVGELVEGDDMRLVVEEFERGVNLGEYTEPDSGNEFASVTVALKNVSDGFVNVSNLLQTRIQDSDGYSFDQTFAAGDTPTFNDGQFAPGEVERGAINFEIPQESSGLELIWDFNLGLFGGLQRAVIDLAESTTVHRLEQTLQVDVQSVGDTVSRQNTSVTVNAVRTEDSLGEFTQPEDGNEFVVVDISIDNNTGDSQRISTALQMYIKDGEGWTYQEDLMATSSLNRAFDEGSPIADGETRRGQVAYEIETERSPLYWVFEFSLWVDGNKTFWQLR